MAATHRVGSTDSASNDLIDTIDSLQSIDKQIYMRQRSPRPGDPPKASAPCPPSRRVLTRAPLLRDPLRVRAGCEDGISLAAIPLRRWCV